jgi:1,4-dihydroxy-2-naphthoate octaprenyltransferase
MSVEGRGVLVDILRLGRFHFLFGGFLLYALGSLLYLASGHHFDSGRFAFGYAILFCSQLSVSYSNDYFDTEADSHSEPTPFSGGSGVLVENPHLSRISIALSLALMAASTLLAVAFVVVFAAPAALVLFSVAGNLLGWYYTAPPLSLVYRGWGEAAMMVTVGLLVPGFGYYVLAGGLDMPFYIMSPLLMMMGLIFIVNVQTPDMEADIKGGKRTIVTLRGRRFAFRFPVLLYLMAVGYLCLMGWMTRAVLDVDLWLIAALALVPTGVSVAGMIASPVDRRGAARASTSSVASLFFFVMLVDAYLIWHTLA